MLKMFSVYDSKAEFYLPPFYFKSKGEALRAFSETVNDSKSTFYKYPGDFTLFEVGEFDETSCSFNLLITPVSQGVAVEFLNDSFSGPVPGVMAPAIDS